MTAASLDGEPRGIGWPIQHRATTASTSDDAKAWARAGAPHGAVVTADRQTSGRGRLGRAWVSEPGNLFLSVVLRHVREPSGAGWAGLAVALATADLIDSLTAPGTARLKWPNDVLVGEAKIAGILLEAEPAPGGGLDWLVAGIGVNLARAPVTTDGLRATAIAELAPAPAPDAVVAPLAAHLGARLRQPAPRIRADWLARAAYLGQLVTTGHGQARLTGRFRDLDANGHLVLDLPDGGTRRIASGEVLVAPGAG